MISHAKATSAKPTSDRANGRPDLRLGPILALFALLLLALALAPGLARAAGAPEHPFLSETPVAQPRGLATDSAGDLFLAREKNPAKANKPEVTIYDPSLHEITSFEPAANAATPVGVAVDSAGNVYVQGQNSDVVKYVPTPAGLPTPTTTYAPDTSCNATGTLASGGAKGVAVNPANDQVLVSFPDHISSYQSDCTPISETIGSTVSGANYTSVAVRGKNGRIFAYDNVENEYKVLVFDPAGSEVLFEIDGSNSNAGAFSTDGSTVAIDQPSGHVYVSDILGSHNVVDEFDAAGEFVTEIVHSPAFSTGTAVKPNALALAPAGAPNAGNVYLVSNVGGGGGKFSAFGPLKVPSHPFLSETPVAQPRGLATDSAGDLFLAREKNPAKANKPEVTIYDPSLHEITSFEPAANAATPVGVAVDSAGNVYVQGQNSDVVKYVPTPAGLPTPTTTYAPDTSCNATGTLASGGAKGVAVNPANDQVLVSFPDHISSYQSDCTPISETIGSTVSGANYTSVAVRGKNGRIFAYDNVENEYKVLVFDPAGSEVLFEIDGSNSNAGAFSTDGSTVAIDQPSGHVYVSDILGSHNVVDEFDAAGEFVTEIVHSPAFSTGTAVKPNALALAPAGAPNAGNVYLVSNVGGGGGKFSAFGPLTYAASFTLKVGKKGTGTVSSSPAGIACGATCEAKFEEGTEVTLTATVDSSSGFASWSGCDSVVGNECKVTVAADTEVIATFVAFKLKVEKNGNGKGTVASAPAGISCGASCKAAEANFAPGTVVTLTATPEAGSKLKTWSGCASSSGNECTLTMSAAREVTATFSAKPSIEATVAHPHDTSATLTAEVNPNGEETTYQFEYLSEDEYQANGESFSGAIKAPASPASIGEGSKAVFVAQHIGGLTPEAAYRYRLVASNAVGEAEAEATFTTYASPQVFEACPNDALRAGPNGNAPSVNLPDCRAYEQASPVHKNGSNAQGTVRMAKASINGDAVTFESAAGVPGGEGAQEFPYYLASRGADGWSTQGLLPPPSTGQGASVLGWTPDFSQVFDEATQFGVGSALLVRSSAGGALTTIAPYAPHARPNFEGASSDGSKVFFESEARLLPEAAEGRQNLYAWARGGALRLASVLPDGSTPPHNSLAGIADGYNQDNHAVASDGSSIDFNEFGTGKLFLRLNPTAPETAQKDGEGNCVPDPVLACTVQVNASEKENGSGLHGHDAAGPRPATFMNATPDGSVAFFTSPEKLTDDASTGPEPTPPAIARANLSDGSGTELGFLPARAKGVEEKGGYLYWANPGEGNEGEGSIGRAKLNGPADASEVEEEFVAGLYDPQGVAVDAQHVYWTETKEGNIGEGTIGRADLPTNPGDPPANVDRSCIAGANDPLGIDVDSTYVYWANAAIGAVGRADITGDCSTANSSANQSLYVDAVEGDIAVNATDIYYSFQSGSGGLIRKISIDGTGANQRVTEFPSTQAPSIALDGSHLYWTNSGESKIGREDLDTPAEGCGAAVDSHGDLFVNDNGTIFVYGPSGAPIARADLGFKNTTACQIAVDSQGDLYVVENGGAVTKFAPSNPGAAPTTATTFAPDPSIGEGSPGANDGNGIVASGDNYAVAVDPSNDNLYVAALSHVSEYHPDGTLVTDAIGTGVSGPEYRSVAVYGQNHNVYVGDRSLSKAYVFAAADLSGPPLVTIDGSGTPAHELHVGGNGVGSAVDQSNGHLYLFDEGHAPAVNEFDASGAYVSQLSDPSFSGGGIALDDSGGANDGDVYVVTQHAVDAFGPFPHQHIASLSHGSIDQSFIAGAGRPQGLAVDASHLYWSANQEFQPNPGNDLYRFDASAPAGERLTDVAPDHNPSDACPGTGGTPCGAQVQGVLGASEDGSYLYYVANGVPDGGVENSPNANGEEAELGDCKGPYALASGTCNLYLYHEGATIFIARLGAGRDVANWVPLPGISSGEGQGFQKTARLSADGRTLLFRSSRQLSAYDNEGASELYRYQVGDAGPNCVTCNPTGAPPGPGSGAALGSINAPVVKAGAPAPILSRNLSAEGNRVFFETADALVAADTDGDEGCPIVVAGENQYPACQDVYEWEAKGTGSCNSETQDGGCLYLLSTGKSTQPSFFADASASGEDVFIFTPDRLVRQDEDELVDVYDVSVGGGLASQNEVPPVPCEGEACKEGTPSAPPSQSAGSASFSGSGNPKPRHKKPRKRHRHHAKKHHHKRHNRNANTTGRASR